MSFLPLLNLLTRHSFIGFIVFVLLHFSLRTPLFGKSRCRCLQSPPVILAYTFQWWTMAVTERKQVAWWVHCLCSPLNCPFEDAEHKQKKKKVLPLFL